MKKSWFILLIVSLTISACRKKKEPESASTTNSPLVLVAGSGYYGWCRAYNQYDYLLNLPQSASNPSYTLSFARSFFTWNELSPTSTFFDYINGGIVVVNSSDTLYYSNQVYNKSIADTFYLPSVKWSVSGCTTAQKYIPAFTYTCNEVFPSFTGFSSLNDSVSKAAGCNFVLTGFSNADRCIFYIQDDFIYESPRLNAAVINDSVKVNFTSTEISNLSSVSGYYHLYVYNDTIRNIGDRNIRFSNVTYYRFVNLNIVN